MATSKDDVSNKKSDHSTSANSSAFAVISWNVLHMIHEINYVYDMSPVIERYSIKTNASNEQRRLTDIVKTISELLVRYSTMECFICLQEVPGDLIPMLHQMLDSHVGSKFVSKPSLHMKTYSRQPRVDRPGINRVYTDSNESLVTIHHNPYSNSNNDRIHWTPCPDDNGKGALSITTSSNITVVNIHVPFKNPVAMGLLNNIVWPGNNHRFVMVGDMNRYVEPLMKMINQPSSGQLLSISTDKPSRVGRRQDGTLQKTWIDYYIISPSLKPSVNPPAIVHDEIGDISDHFPIILTFTSTS